MVFGQVDTSREGVGEGGAHCLRLGEGEPALELLLPGGCSAPRENAEKGSCRFK